MAAARDMCRLIHGPSYARYDLGAGHPFSPDRWTMLVELLEALGVPARLEEPEPLEPGALLAVHDPEFVDAVEAASRGEPVDDPGRWGLGTADNPVVPGMAEGARAVAGGTVLGARLLLEGVARRVLQVGGGLHHARRALASGFCLYNDLALAIETMVRAGWHVAYIDLDVHHGDGVQEIFYASDRVLTLSLHETGEYLFPGTGWVHETGRGMGRGLSLNLPLEPFTEGDTYRELFGEIAAAALEWFRPDAVVVQAGADAHWADPLADLLLTTQDYEAIVADLLALVERTAGGRVLVTLGGGYDPAATVRVWLVVALGLLGVPVPERLPEAWRRRWSDRLGREVPGAVHDPPEPYRPVPRRPEIVRADRDLLRRLLDAVAADWL